MQRLADMAVFAAVVEAEGFAAAARALGLSKSAVSKQVARLEARLGARLLNRTTRSLSLTDAGAEFFEGCRRMLAEAEAAEASVTRFSGQPQGRLKVSAPMSFGILHLAPALPDFMRRCPEVTVDLDLNDRRIDLVEEGFDLGVRIGQLADSSLVSRRLAASRSILCAAPAYVAARGHPQRPEDLRGHDCLIYSYVDRPDLWRFKGPSGARRVGVSGRLQANNGDVLLTAALAGQGIARLPSFMAGPHVAAGRLLELLPDWRDAREIEVHAVYPARRQLAPKTRVFIDFLAGRFADPAPWDRPED